MDRNEILKVTGHREHIINKSWGVYDAYKWIRKNKWFDIGRPLKEDEFYKIIRGINIKLAEMLSLGADIKLPYKMGILEIRKYNTYVRFINGELCTNRRINWDETLKLWCEDEEAYKNRTLIKAEDKEIFAINYNKVRAEYTNKSFYQFRPTRELTKALRLNVKKGIIEAFNK